MTALNRIAPALLVLAALAMPAAVRAQSLSVDVWTDKGNDAVYQPGDAMQVRARVNDDAYLLVYEIDSDGFVHVIYPVSGETGRAPANGTLNIPDQSSSQELVVENNTGLDYIVAIASRQPFGDLPWYLRPYNAQGDAMGYVNQPTADEEGVTTDGRIVGDPFVAMERIRRRVISVPNDASSFATAYTSYYVHEQVQYPRYICNDCHRPGHYAWWDGWDPYYSTCSAVSFHVNWSWVWGPSYWYGYVPYYVYSYNPGCPPQYRWPGGSWCSSWDGWNRWTQYWNGGLVRYKSPPPVGYRSPAVYGNWKNGSTAPPPGMLVLGRNSRAPLSPGGAQGSVAAVQGMRQGGIQRVPVTRAPGDPGAPQAGRVPVSRNPAELGGPRQGRMPETPGGGERGPQAGRMPATPGDNVDGRAQRQAQRAPVTPWRTPDQPRGIDRGASDRAPVQRMRGDYGGRGGMMTPRSSYFGRGGGYGGGYGGGMGFGRSAPVMRGGGGGGSPARGGGSPARGGGSPARGGGGGGGGRSAPAHGGGGGRGGR
jgi:hypothetical protein